MMVDEEQKYFPIKKDPACPLKWNWSTIWTTTGETASCHKCKRVPIDIDKFDEFHNLPHKINERKIMLSGKWPTVANGGSGHCEVCKEIEDNGGLSDRQQMKGIPNQVPPELRNNPTATSVTPRIFELFVSNTCNLQCTYCNTRDSSKINLEAKKHGPIIFPDGESVGRYQYQAPHPQAVGYFRKSLKWYEANGHKLKRFHLLGGEPFYMKETIPVLETLAKVKNRNLEFNIVSNMMCTPDRLEMYIDKIEQLIRNKNIGRFDLTVSIDGIGPEAEYCRSGMKSDIVLRNMDYIINKKWIIVNVNSVMTSLTIKPYLKLIRYVNEKRKIRRIGQYFGQDIGTRDFLHPMAQGGEFWREDMEKLINEIEDYDGRSQFQEHLTGIWKSFEKSKPNRNLIDKFKFYLDELDRRRNTNWRKIYPYLDI